MCSCTRVLALTPGLAADIPFPEAVWADSLALPRQLASLLGHSSCQQWAREPGTWATPALPTALSGEVGGAPAGHRKSSQLGLKGNRFYSGPD